MKKCILLSLMLTLVLSTLIGQEKTIIGLTASEISTLQERNPDFNVNLEKFDYQYPQYFNSFESAQNYVDSLRIAMRDMINITERSVQITPGTAGRFAECGCGDYSASAGSAGLFSSFNVSFSYCNGSVSNANINTSGLQIGWTLGGTTSSYNGLYSCSTATATFSIGIFSWTQIVRISWHFNPNTCTFYYNIGSGPCGGILNY